MRGYCSKDQLLSSVSRTIITVAAVVKATFKTYDLFSLPLYRRNVTILQPSVIKQMENLTLHANIPNTYKFAGFHGSDFSS
jgi:hypothetical protein